MSYVVFTFRKLLLTSDIADLNKELTDLCYQQQNLAAASSIFGTGSVTKSDYNELNAGSRGIAESAMNYLASGGGVESANAARVDFTEKAVQALNDKVYRQEKIIDMKRGRLETQLTAKNNELESVKKAEETAIKNSTPKYA